MVWLMMILGCGGDGSPCDLELEVEVEVDGETTCQRRCVFTDTGGAPSCPDGTECTGMVGDSLAYCE